MAAISAEGQEAKNQPKIEAVDLEVSLTEMKMGAGIIEFYKDDVTGKKGFSYSSDEGKYDSLTEAFELPHFDITKVKRHPFLWLNPHDKETKSICITFKSSDAYELFLANWSERGGRTNTKTSKSFKLVRKKNRAAKRNAKTVHEDHFSEEKIGESTLQSVKFRDVNLSCPQTITPNENSNGNFSSEEDGQEDDSRGKEEKNGESENILKEMSAPGPLKSDDDYSNSDSDKKTSSEEEDGGEEEEEDYETEGYMAILETTGRSAKDKRQGR